MTAEPGTMLFLNDDEKAVLEQKIARVTAFCAALEPALEAADSRRIPLMSLRGDAEALFAMQINALKNVPGGFLNENR